jgi:PncC family amidohydrolase
MESANTQARLLARQVAALAIERVVTLATAESCTTGLVAHLLGQTAGVSSVLRGGVVAYANEAKRDLLGVPAVLLEEHGAVSEPVALAMARGARSALGADVAVSTTGVAGPGGGSAEKPVGLVYIAISAWGGEECRRFQFDGDREENMESAAYEALRLLMDALSTATG